MFYQGQELCWHFIKIYLVHLYYLERSNQLSTVEEYIVTSKFSFMKPYICGLRNGLNKQLECTLFQERKLCVNYEVTSW